LIDNFYVTFGYELSCQKIGIPMVTDCSPFLANLFYIHMSMNGLISNGVSRTTQCSTISNIVVDT
jgi:hypothetical protein